jgi:hypothetical protein
MPEIIVCDEHHQVYEIWRARNQKGLAVSHVDFHCDMRGLLINRTRGCAHFVDPNDTALRVVDPGNYLAHAIMEGIVRRVDWIHDVHGGRRYDVGTVKFESDLSIIRQRVLHQRRGDKEVQIAFKELTFDTWDGNLAGHQLDIDWDAIASINYDLPYIRKLMKGFLIRDFPVIPETTFVVYSPGYSNPDRALYEEFIESLAEKFLAQVQRLPLPGSKPEIDHRFIPRLKHKLVEGLHRLNIY